MERMATKDGRRHERADRRTDYRDRQPERSGFSKARKRKRRERLDRIGRRQESCRGDIAEEGGASSTKMPEPAYDGKGKQMQTERADAQEGQGQERTRGKFPWGIGVAVVALLAFCAGALYMYTRPKVSDGITAEAGSSMPAVSEFLLRSFGDTSYTDEKRLPDMDKVGDYEVGITIRGREYTSVLHVVDTTLPSVSVKKVCVLKGSDVRPEDFIKKIEDATKTKVAYAARPNFASPGDQIVDLKVVDEGGNETEVEAELRIVEDKVPPKITGVKELSVVLGKSISYKRGVKVTDNFDSDVALEVDSSKVKLNELGDYPVVYKARDSAGNIKKKRTTVHVVAPDRQELTEEMVYAKADEILQKITKPGMGQMEVARCIFDWVHDNIRWSDGSPKTSWVEGAYMGLYEQRGDCFVYASASKCLLTKAGIKNTDIMFSNKRRTHYWNLVDMGEGWYHFDATRRTDGRSFFYCKDSVIREYSARHGGSHAYNPEDYPEIQ